MTSPNIKEIRQLYNLTQEEFAQALGITRELVNKMEKGRCGVSKATRLLIRSFQEARKSDDFSHPAVSDVQIFGAAARPSRPQPYFLERQSRQGSHRATEVPLVGIKAQAGYIRGFEETDYLDTLEKYALPPGVNPTGAVWSYFEVDGESMEPTFYSGDLLLASMLPQEDWHDVKNFCVYVLLTTTQLMVKRVYRKSDQEWVLISDNEEAAPQVLLPVSDLKQVWTFRRHIRAKLPQKEFKITA
ncbi:S24 family peptidase [Flaviaesturariibacter aridisoli]|uniref:Helix-turn-helix domain-containing protein n=1 Tax=Flaviaesturariibacter aridisoli TaxID=2545761 RepID=A0A4R4E1E9_9BACT|nr:S24 family peptidase [Flaviaesturariibacter aridisoli]TCZ71430.1 helix-turn-helix domain-containing protein [Flaviaesturariibacter aridisoli]